MEWFIFYRNLGDLNTGRSGSGSSMNAPNAYTDVSNFQVELGQQ